MRKTQEAESMEKNDLYLKYIEEIYVELAELGSGETGKTFLARHRGSGKIVVKKLVPVQTGKIYERIKEIHHPNLARVYEVCYCENVCVVIEEYISGETLEEKLEELKVLPQQTVTDYLLQILQGVSEIHKQGIVHRDLTPSNILISTDNVVKLIDFGIARNPKENQKKDTLILGTVGYASPEQFGFLQTDNRTDIYAIGILLNKMLTEKLPNEQLTENKKFQRIVEKCIQIDPEKRYATVDEILYELAGNGVYEKGNLQNISEIDKSIWPGFRSGERWRRVVGTIGYALMLIYSVECLIECGKTFQTFSLELLAILIYVWVTFLVASNFGRWDRRWKPFSKMSREVTITIRVILSFCTIYFGVLLENYVRYTMLGLPRPK